jgi:hypothetical protein
MGLRILVYVPPFFFNHHGNTRTHEAEGGGRGRRTHAHLSVPDHAPAWLLLLAFPSRPPPLFLFPPFLPLHIAGAPAIKDGRPCAHPLCTNRLRDVKEGTQHATVNDWGGSTGREATCGAGWRAAPLSGVSTGRRPSRAGRPGPGLRLRQGSAAVWGSVCPQLVLSFTCC